MTYYTATALAQELNATRQAVVNACMRSQMPKDERGRYMIPETRMEEIRARMHGRPGRPRSER